MPNTYTQLLFHIVFSTENRERTLTDGKRDALYKYIWGIHSNLNCHLYRIGGVDDHVHILTALPTTLAPTSKQMRNTFRKSSPGAAIG